MCNFTRIKGMIKKEFRYQKYGQNQCIVTQLHDYYSYLISDDQTLPHVRTLELFKDYSGKR